MRTGSGQAASSLGAAEFCINESIKCTHTRKPFSQLLSHHQSILFPLVVELATQCQMLQLLIRKTAAEMDSMPHMEVEKELGMQVSMCNYWANRLCCEAADRAFQVHGRAGYSKGETIRAYLETLPQVSDHGRKRGDSDEEDRGVFVWTRIEGTWRDFSYFTESLRLICKGKQ